SVSLNSKEFRSHLIWQLIQDAKSVSNIKRTCQFNSKLSIPKVHLVYITKNSKLPICRQIPRNHILEWRDKREACIWCCYLEKQERNKNPPQTNLWCYECDVPLCCNKTRPHCNLEFHTHND
ncbi:4890_t:CDS:1, partial [Cetraspora pellucida]